MNPLVLTPAVWPAAVVAASFAGRRRGAAIGGWIAGAPLTTELVAAFPVAERGPNSPRPAFRRRR
jgi:hypothetical protein